MNAIDELTDSFSRLPGIGKKSAGRLVNYILKADSSWVKRFSSQIASLQEKIKNCSVCGCWTEDDPCAICSNNLRDHSLICVVEQPQDVNTIESSHEYNGLFHVLGGVIAPLEGVGPDQLRIAELLDCVIVATIGISPNTITLLVILILVALRILIRIQQVLVVLDIYQFILWQDFSINNIRRIKAQEFSSWLLLEVRK